MIEDVAQYFKVQVGNSREIREASYDMFVHRIRVKRNTIVEIMVQDVLDICAKINDTNKDIILDPQIEPIKRLISSKFGRKFNASYADTIFKRFANEVGQRELVSVGKGVRLQKNKNYRIESSDRQLTIILAAGLIDMKNSYINKKRKGTYNVVLAVVRRIYGAVLAEVRKEIIDTAKKRVPDANVSGISDITSEYLLIRGHGVTAEGGRRPDERQGQQTTTGILDTIKKLSDKLNARIEEHNKGTKDSSLSAQLLGKAMDEVLAAYTDVLEKHFELGKFYDIKKLEWNEELVIEIEIISRSMTATGVLAQRAMDPFDYKAVTEDLVRRATKKLNSKLPTMARIWATMTGSKSRQEMYEDWHTNTVIDTLIRDIKTKKAGGKGGVDFRLKVNKKLKKKLPKRGRAGGTAGFTIGKLQKTITKSAAADYAAKKKQIQKRGQGKTAESPIALRNILNEALPQMVASKMTPPALQFRTGRFANSARVENVNIGPRGGLHVDYTYMRNPYETFEPGGKQGSTQRDPRKIIGASIRELAMGILGRQPTTLRRN